MTVQIYCLSPASRPLCRGAGVYGACGACGVRNMNSGLDLSWVLRILSGKNTSFASNGQRQATNTVHNKILDFS